METIDDEVDSYGMALVTTEVKCEVLWTHKMVTLLEIPILFQDIIYAGSKLNIRKFPALGMFR